MASDKIKVAVRVRPFNRRELELGTQCVVDMEEQQTVLQYPQAHDKDSFPSRIGLGSLPCHLPFLEENMLTPASCIKILPAWNPLLFCS